MAGPPISLHARRLLLIAAAAGYCCLLLLQGAAAARQLASPAPEADALLKFKDGIVSNNDALRSWSPGTSPCNGDASNWVGVICHKDTVIGLQLENMGLSGKLDLRQLKSLGSLRTASFRDNEFAGPMPDVKELHGLRALFLSENKFSGEIPADAFEGMGSLKKIHLSKNSFSGSIPTSLADVPKLVDLSLNDNKFQGKIPNFQQKELKIVNVANNQLEGEIPASLQLLNADMFAGNKKLCGGSLDTKCEASSSPPHKPGTATSSSPPTSDKAGTPPSPPAPSAEKTTGLLPDDATQDAQKPTEGSMSSGVLLVFLGALAIIACVLVALKRRRENNNQNFSSAMSKKPSMRKISAEPAKDTNTGPSQSGPSPAAAAAAGSDTRAGGAARMGAEAQGRLTFVREDRGRFFELQDLLKATAEVLGTSSSNLGVCYRATLTGGQSVVVKRFKEMNRVGREEFEEHMRRLGRLSHPNLLPLVAYYYRKEEKLLMHEYAPNKSLAHLLHGDGRGIKKAVVHWTARLKIVKGVARALNYMYDELPMLTVPHGHLKSSNVLLDERYDALLNDYALVPVMNQSHAAQLLTASKSPEWKQSGQSSKKSDVWCLGLLILEIITGRPPSYDLHHGKAAPEPEQQTQKPAAGGGNDLAGQVASTPEEEWLKTVVDGDLKYEGEECKGEMVKLIRIAMACCDGNVESRWELKDAAERIEELKGNQHDNEESSFYSSIGDGDDRNGDFNNVT